MLDVSARVLSINILHNIASLEKHRIEKRRGRRVLRISDYDPILVGWIHGCHL